MGADALAFMDAAVVEDQGEAARDRHHVADLQLAAGIRDIAHEAVDHALLSVEDDLGALQRLLAVRDSAIAAGVRHDGTVFDHGLDPLSAKLPRFYGLRHRGYTIEP